MGATIALIGMGPRGISVVERIAAQKPEADLEIHAIDDSMIGAGRIWDTAQTKTLCMNTLAGAVTLFTEPNSTVSAPVVIGPTMFEWIRLLRGENLEDQGDWQGEKIADLKAKMVAAHPPVLGEVFDDELAETRPESNPSRALYGEYLAWCYRVAKAALPDNVTLIEHQIRAVAIDEEGDFDTVYLADGSMIQADATIMATGWQTPAYTPAEQEFADAAGTWIAPDNPVEQKVNLIPGQGKVLVRGLGMGFFDLMALLTFDRGGRFVEDESTRSGLRYEPSGREPHLYVASGRGYPFLPKSEYKSLPPKAALTRLRQVIDELSDVEPGSASIDFTAQVWPAIVRDAFEAYYRVLAEQKPDALAQPLDALLQVIEEASPESIEADLADLVPDVHDRFSINLWMNPLAGLEDSLEAVTERIATSMARDIQEAVAARDSAIKAGLWSISASRKPASILGSQGRYTWESRRDRFNAFMAFGQMIGSGPPLFRTRQLLALVDAGLVTFVGQRPRTWVEGKEFAMISPTTNTEIRADVLVDAWMHSPDIRQVADPLVLSLKDRLRPFAEVEADGTPVETGSPEIDPATRTVVHPDGAADERLHLIGIPTYAQMPDTTISPMPGTNPLMLQETDRAAVHALEVAVR